ncbi:hypothetical protein L2E82_12260 [Cichorium intybus]|uniref:Uncharacterized protein n=1 Tax=Cichorium intybus TaxID=13427 RepID=A0ACB9GGQ3_CICIN|nr:hypothetical protein L2E82_12260 [Cichorium intybus]
MIDEDEDGEDGDDEDETVDQSSTYGDGFYDDVVTNEDNVVTKKKIDQCVLEGLKFARDILPKRVLKKIDPLSPSVIRRNAKKGKE